ncbi:hypothetical protein ABIE56_000346 [Luteibacter sp. 621]|uniref:hypothetical protein n=1 Tax=Luteibacter sp. 621 TaxID=3373916 RepID=UPI003D1FEA1B
MAYPDAAFATTYFEALGYTLHAPDGHSDPMWVLRHPCCTDQRHTTLDALWSNWEKIALRMVTEDRLVDHLCRYYVHAPEAERMEMCRWARAPFQHHCNWHRTFVAVQATCVPALLPRTWLMDTRRRFQSTRRGYFQDRLVHRFARLEASREQTTLQRVVPVAATHRPRRRL